MRFRTPVLVSVGVAAGTVVAAVAYQSVTPAPALVRAPVAPTSQAPAPVRTEWLPCAPGAHLRHGVCVTIHEHVVGTAGPAAPAAPAPSKPGAAKPQPGPATPAAVAASADPVVDEQGETTDDHGDDHGDEPGEHESDAPEPGEPGD